MRFRRYILAFLYFSLLISLLILLIPKSIGGAYQVNMLSNIYFSDLGTSSYIVLNPISLIGYISIIKILYLLSDINLFSLIKVLGVFFVPALIASYQLLMNSIPGDKNVKIFVSLLYPIVLLGLDSSILRSYVSSFTIPLCLIILFFLFLQYNKNHYSPFFIVVLISFIALSFFWHTANIMIYFIIFIYISLDIILKLNSNNKIIPKKWNFLILISVVFFSIWFYFRVLTINQVFQNLYLDFDIHSLLNRGSYTGEYSFIYSLPMHPINLIRILGYCISYFIMGTVTIKFFIHVISKIEFSKFEEIISVLFLSDLLFQINYFFAARTAGPRILYFFSQPLLCVYLLSNWNSFNPRFSKFFRILSVLYICSIIITAVSGIYIHIHDDPESNIPVEMYNSNFRWIEKHASPQKIVSDSHTIGHYQLLYVSSGLNKENQIIFRNMNYKTYLNISSSTYSIENNTLLIINHELYRKHLVFGSLENWNKFEPLEPKSIEKNKLNLLYNDGKVLVAK